MNDIRSAAVIGHVDGVYDIEENNLSVRFSKYRLFRFIQVNDHICSEKHDWLNFTDFVRVTWEFRLSYSLSFHVDSLEAASFSFLLKEIRCV